MGQTQIIELAEHAARIGEKQEAARLYYKFLLENPGNISVWLDYERVLDDPAEKKHCLDWILSLNPRNHFALQRLEELFPQPKPAAKETSHVLRVGVPVNTPDNLHPLNQSPAWPKFKICPYCNCENIVTAQFCNSCGKPFDVGMSYSSLNSLTQPAYRPIAPLAVDNPNSQENIPAVRQFNIPEAMQDGGGSAIGKSFLIYFIVHFVITFLIGIATVILFQNNYRDNAGLFPVLSTAVASFFVPLALRNRRYKRSQIMAGAVLAVFVSVFGGYILGMLIGMPANIYYYFFIMTVSAIAAILGVLVFVKNEMNFTDRPGSTVSSNISPQQRYIYTQPQPQQAQFPLPSPVQPAGPYNSEIYDPMYVSKPAEALIAETLGHLPAAKQEMFWTQYQKIEKNPTTAKWLCFFLGGFGANYFYSGQIGTGLACILATLTIFGIPIIISFFVAFREPGRILELNEERAKKILQSFV